MRKLRLILLAAVCMSLASVFAASAVPLKEEDPLKEVFLASSHAVKPLPLKCGTYCDLGEGSTTPTSTGIGTTCTIAASNLTTQLHNYANSFCGNPGSCALSVHTTIACHADGGGFSVSGYATFGCRDSTC